MYTEHPIVVGVDGSSADDTALRWAIAEAQTRNTWVRIVRAFRKMPASGSTNGYGDAPIVDTEQFYAEKLLARAERQVKKLDPRIEVQTAALEGDAVSVFVDESARASVVVLYSRRLTSRISAVLRSVGSGVAARTSCPAVAVREITTESATDAAVIGVDGTPQSEDLLEFGFDYASRHQLPLRAVQCWHPRPLSSITSHSKTAPTSINEELSDLLANWSDKYPDVVVQHKVVHEHPVAGLVAESATSRLLIVGSRGHSAFTSSLLGSVSQGVLHQAACPVAVIPSRN
jgi:nucleotide-binding universal stress UspA family protein